MIKFNLGRNALVALIAVCSFSLAAHGPVTPQSIDTSELPQLGEDWIDVNPYREQNGDIRTEILRIGASNA